MPKIGTKEFEKFCIHGRIFQIFRSYFGQCDDFIFSFWNFLTFNLTVYQPWYISRICYGAFGDNGFHSTGLAYNWTWPRITLVSHPSHLLFKGDQKKVFLVKSCKLYFSNFQEPCFNDWINSVPMPFITSAIHWMQCQSGPIFRTCCCSRKFQSKILKLVIKFFYKM